MRRSVHTRGGRRRPLRTVRHPAGHAPAPQRHPAAVRRAAGPLAAPEFCTILHNSAAVLQRAGLRSSAALPACPGWLQRSARTPHESRRTLGPPTLLLTSGRGPRSFCRIPPTCPPESLSPLVSSSTGIPPCPLTWCRPTSLTGSHATAPASLGRAQPRRCLVTVLSAEAGCGA